MLLCTAALLMALGKGSLDGRQVEAPEEAPAEAPPEVPEGTACGEKGGARAAPAQEN